MALTLAVPATAQTTPPAAQCNGKRLFTIKKVVFLGPGTLAEGGGDRGRNAVQVDRPANCDQLDASLTKRIDFCMNVWDTTPCTGDQCGAIETKVSGIITRFSTHLVCAYIDQGVAAQLYLVTATNNNDVKDNPTNRFIVALDHNPHQNAVFDIRDDD